ncbi:hypothetical protein AAHC03_013737 [Spirometra sp. Aus1]
MGEWSFTSLFYPVRHIFRFSESRQDDLTDLLSEPAQCKPHYDVLASNSPCTTFLASFANREGDTYQVRNSSLARLTTLDRKIDRLFRAWNVMIFGEEGGNASDYSISPSDCLFNAKLLTCLLTYPPCLETQEVEESLNGQEISYGRLKKRSVQQSEEIPLCRQHCVVITSLMCASPFGQTANQAPLAHLFTRAQSGPGDEVDGGYFQTGWTQLLRAHQRAGLDLLTSPTGHSILSSNLTHAKAVEVVCGGLPSMEDEEERCLSVDFEAAMASAVPSAASTPNDSALVATDNRDCYVDRGQDYRGPAVASANCLSWEEVAQFSPLEDDSVTREDEGNGMSTDLPSGQPSMSQIGWPGLFTLTPTLFPDTLGSSSSPSSLLSVPSEAPATCRNPLGLAPQPFCLVAHAVDPDSSTPQLVPIPCFQLPSCAQLRAAALITEAPSPSTDIGAVRSSFYNASIRVSFLFGIVGVTLFIFLLAYVVQVRLHKRDPPGKQVLAISQVTGPQAHRLAQLQRRRLVRRTPRPLRCLLLRLLRSGRHLPSKPSEATLKGCPSSDDRVSCFTCGSKTAKGLPTPASTKIFDSVDEEDEEFEQLAASMRVPVRQSVGAPPALPACFPAAFNGSGDTVDGLPPDESSILARTQLSDQPTYFEKGPRADQAAFEVDTYYSVEAVGNVLHPKLKGLAYPRKLLIELRPIAQRAFGTVILARAPNLPVSVSQSPSDTVQSTTGPSVPPTTSPLVVIKTLHFNADSVAQFSFLREAELLVEFNHPNILKVLGLCVPLQPLTLVCEYMPRGDLNSCLRRLHAAGDSGEESALSVDRLLGIAADICEAMIYLGYKSYVHRDLATRSCLLATDWTAKLSDFSMCRLVNRGADLVDRGVSALPVRWLPVESLLDGIFNFDTDVWSFGVFLWELFTFGAVPFEDASVSEIIKGLLTGKRLSCPDGCCPAVYELMLQCWSDDRSQRPTFLHIKKTLSSLAAR